VISVCLASHNGQEFLECQIRSILAQLGPGDELLVSDDTSTDGSLDLIHSLGDSRIRLFEGRFGGPIPNFEFLLRQAQGDWIVLSDQDDEWLPGRIDALLEIPDSAQVVLCDAIVTDLHGNLLARSLLEHRKAKPGWLANLRKNHYTGCCLAIRSNFLPHILPFPTGIGMHDWWIGLVAERLAVSHWIRHPLVRHVRHDRNATSGLGNSRLDWRTKLMMRLRLFWLTVRL
jgi:glycosyltransferase involved in cell wall biosynthesis